MFPVNSKNVQQRIMKNMITELITDYNFIIWAFLSSLLLLLLERQDSIINKTKKDSEIYYVWSLYLTTANYTKDIS